MEQGRIPMSLHNFRNTVYNWPTNLPLQNLASNYQWLVANIPPETTLTQSVIFERIKTIPSQDRQLQITRLLDPFFTYREHQKQQQKSLAKAQQEYDEGIKKIIATALGH